VNLQNARKIADFPYPYPLAQVSMILQLVHYAIMPIGAALAVPRLWAVCVSFFSIFVLWCIHFNALDLEFPFGTRVNDLPMNEMQQDWNKSICNLLRERATRPPKFAFEAEAHRELNVAMSDASDLYIPRIPQVVKSASIIKIRSHGRRGKATRANRVAGESQSASQAASEKIARPSSDAAVAAAPSGQGNASAPAIPAKREGPDLNGKDPVKAADATLVNRQGLGTQTPANDATLASSPPAPAILNNLAPNSQSPPGDPARLIPPVSLTMVGASPAAQSVLAGNDNAFGDTHRQHGNRQNNIQSPQNIDGLKL